MLEKIRISLNWKAGRYKEKYLYKERRKCMPWLSLDKDRVWISREKFVKCYKRNDRIGPSTRSLAAKGEADICKFVHKQDTLIAGLGYSHISGSIFTNLMHIFLQRWEYLDLDPETEKKCSSVQRLP